MLIFALLLLLGLTGCTNNGAKATLEKQGYRDVTLTGYRFFTCSDDDEFHTGFKALSPDGSGRVVTGTVCEGFIKGKTVRLD